jgi:TonB family protein
VRPARRTSLGAAALALVVPVAAAAAQEARADRCASMRLEVTDTLRATLHLSLAEPPKDRRLRTFMETALQELALLVVPPQRITLPTVAEFGAYVPREGPRDGRLPAFTREDALGLGLALDFTLRRDGSLAGVEVRDSSEAAEITESLLTAVRRADSVRALGVIPRDLGRERLGFHLRVSLVAPTDRAALPLFSVVVPFARLDKPVLPRPENLSPRYPIDPRYRGSGGEVLLEFIVDERGRVASESVRVLKVSNTRFLSPVLALLPSYRFDPAEFRGCPVKHVVRQMFKFSVQ